MTTKTKTRGRPKGSSVKKAFQLSKDERIILLGARNNLKDMRNSLDETQDCHLLDIRNLHEAVDLMDKILGFNSPNTKSGWYWMDYVLSEDAVSEEDVTT